LITFIKTAIVPAPASSINISVADIINQIMTKNATPRPMVLMGHSQGASLALNIAVESDLKIYGVCSLQGFSPLSDKIVGFYE